MLEYYVYAYGTEIIGLLLVAVMGCLGVALRNIYRDHVNDDTKRAVAKAVVAFVEQVWTAIHGPEKLQKALETAEAMLRKKGIPFDADEMQILIEAAVAEFNDAFHKPVDTENAKASYRVPEAAE